MCSNVTMYGPDNMQAKARMNVQIKQTEDGVSYEWQSFDEFVPDLVEIKRNRPGLYKRTVACGTSSWSTDTSIDWWGAKSFEEVQHKIENGWPELREQLLKMMEGIELELPVFPSLQQTRRRKRVRGEFGDDLDIQRVWSGQLDTAWARPVRTQRQAVNTKRITLAFDVTANAMVNNKMALWRAALCTLLVDSLARAGRVFEVWVVDSTSGPFTWHGRPPRNLWSAWCVKQAADPIVLDRLCAMVSVGFMRTAGFMAMGAGPWEPSAGFGAALNRGLPATLRERQAGGEIVLRLGECYSRPAVIQEYKRAWEAVEAYRAIGEAHA